ncbi:E3 ubiquitin-protein ligase UPL7-like protein [Drosera capensis]
MSMAASFLSHADFTISAHAGSVSQAHSNLNILVAGCRVSGNSFLAGVYSITAGKWSDNVAGTFAPRASGKRFEMLDNSVKTAHAKGSVRTEPKERCMLLKFVTSCSRAPLLGFKYLQPIFTIHKDLMSSLCYRLLAIRLSGLPLEDMMWSAFLQLLPATIQYTEGSSPKNRLPTYKRASTLKAKLLHAINSNAGFELS